MYCAYNPRDWEPVDVLKFIRFGERALPSEVPTARAFDVSGTSRIRVPLDGEGRSCARDGSVVYDNTVLVRIFHTL